MMDRRQVLLAMMGGAALLALPMGTPILSAAPADQLASLCLMDDAGLIVQRFALRRLVIEDDALYLYADDGQLIFTAHDRVTITRVAVVLLMCDGWSKDLKLASLPVTLVPGETITLEFSDPVASVY